VSFNETPAIDVEKWMLPLSFRSQNRNGGTIKIIYDVTSLSDIRSNIIASTLMEFSGALLLSIIVLYFASTWITGTVEKLTQFMSSDLQNIAPDQIPAADSDDEIGELARRFRILVADAQSYITEIEMLNIKDPLTGLYNRRHYDDFVDGEVSRVSRTNLMLSFFYIDVDNFKKHNDSYGHKKGDSALVMVSQQIYETLSRTSDLSFRLGGEEFLAVVSTETEDHAVELAEKIRTNIELAAIEHRNNVDYGVVTVSIGVYCARPNPQLQANEFLR
jgi:diguanylate cyclase (GGDEF)-like protein